MKEVEVARIWEQPPDAIVCFGESAQVAVSKGDVTLQFYETIPGVPDANGKITTARSRLRVTVFLTKEHAANIGRILSRVAEERSEQ